MSLCRLTAIPYDRDGWNHARHLWTSQKCSKRSEIVKFDLWMGMCQKLVRKQYSRVSYRMKTWPCFSSNDFLSKNDFRFPCRMVNPYGIPLDSEFEMTSHAHLSMWTDWYHLILLDWLTMERWTKDRNNSLARLQLINDCSQNLYNSWHLLHLSMDTWAYHGINEC